MSNNVNMHDNVYLGTSMYDLKYLHIAWIEQSDG